MTPQQPPAGYLLRKTSSPYSQGLGPYYFKKESGFVQQGFWVQSKHINGSGVTHGGMIAAFADNVMAGALYGEIKARALTVQMNLQFISVAKEGEWLEGKGNILRITKSLAFCEADLFVEDRVVAKASGIFKRPTR